MELSTDCDSAEALLNTPPVLQNPAADGMTVTWAVSALATGWVEYGPTPELGMREMGAQWGMNPINARFFRVRLQGLPAGQPFYYRVVSAPVQFARERWPQCGAEEASSIYRAVTLDAGATQTSFAVLNDTHAQAETVQRLLEILASDSADLTVWNGDMISYVVSEEQIVEQILRPAGRAYAAEKPVLFVTGNHDCRGAEARALPQAVSVWEEEAPLSRCFAIRQGPLAIIGLDTGENYADCYPLFGGLASFESYRRAQRDWLAAALQRPEIASAPYLVVFCHIPLWGLPGNDPSDPSKDPGYRGDAQQLWHPLLQEAGAQLVISGHTHKFRYDAPTSERCYAQLVGGGPKPEEAVLLRGQADSSRLELIATDLDRNELGRWQFAPRLIPPADTIL